MRGGGALLKSVSLFLSSGRRASRSAAPQPPPPSPPRKQQSPSKRASAAHAPAPAPAANKKMGDEKSPAQQAILNNTKSSAKIIDSLKKQTHFS
ncbi:hypothetical protein J6590_001221, partial [Homalodisca vitripennis]